MAPKRKAVNRKKRMRSPSLEAQAQLEPDEVEERPCSPEPQTQLDPTDADDTARKVDTVASERDSSISRSEASDDCAATVTAKIIAAKNKNRKPHNKIARSLTNEEEDEVIEWLKSNRFLYDKPVSSLRIVRRRSAHGWRWNRRCD